MTKKKKIKIGISIVAVVFLLAIVSFIAVRVIAYNQTNFQRAFPENKGLVSNIQIPKGSRPVGPYAMHGEKIKTYCTEQQVKKFYSDYFYTLPRVSSYQITEGMQAYYDKEQQLIIYDRIYFMHEWDGLYFAIMYEPYGNGAGVRIVEEPKNRSAQS